MRYDQYVTLFELMGKQNPEQLGDLLDECATYTNPDDNTDDAQMRCNAARDAYNELNSGGGGADEGQFMDPLGNDPCDSPFILC
jgi:hypothetical protein